jgi:hypothetical protein
MLYGTEKRRQMARSILPSTSRRASAADLARVRRGHRRRINQELHHLAPPGSRVDGHLLGLIDAGPHLKRYPTAQIREVMWERRGADKVNHFLRWAVVVTAHLPLEARLDHLRGLLPPGLIGRHALSHAEFHPALGTDRWWWARPRPEPSEDERQQLAAMLREVLESPGEHAAFNRAMKRGLVDADGVPLPHRVLLGLHDVAPFLDDVYGPRPRGLTRAIEAPRLGLIRSYAAERRDHRSD